ncbi:MAG: PorT family protein [Bacteroidales bacterium]|nr:PorT family protein [Bacteroidales bacterium]
MTARKNTPLNCKTILLLSFIACVLQIPVYGQEDCTARLQQAREYYEQGLIGELPELLLPCIEEGFTRAQKMEAYKLLILAYLFDYDQAEAERNMVEFLKKYPEYEVSPDDPVEFVYLFESYRTTSVFSVGVTAGFSLTDPRIIEPYTLLDYSYTDMKNNMKTGFHLGLGMARYISRRMLINVELNFEQNQYSFTDELTIPVVDGTDVMNRVVYNEKLYKFEIPLTLTYEFNVGNMNSFLRTGIFLTKVSGAKGQPSRKYDPDLPPVSGEYESVKDYRKDFLYGLVAGAGIRYKISRGVISIGLRANLGLNNIVKSAERYYNPILLSKYYYVDDDFTLNTFSLTAGYYFSFYTPSKQR